MPRHQRDFDETPKEKDDDAVSNLKDNWVAIRDQGRKRGKSGMSLPLLIVGLGMIIVIFYLLTHYETT